MFSLIPNADEIMFRICDDYGEFTCSYYNRENLHDRYGMEYFTAEAVKQAAESLDSFTDYLNRVSAIKNPEDYYSEEEKERHRQSMDRSKQLYSVIGDDCEIMVNSGINFFVTITEDIAANLFINGLAEEKDTFEPYIGKEIEFIKYRINNYKTNISTTFVFVFDAEKMIGWKELKTTDAERKVIQTFRALEQGKFY